MYRAYSDALNKSKACTVRMHALCNMEELPADATAPLASACCNVLSAGTAAMMLIDRIVTPYDCITNISQINAANWR